MYAGSLSQAAADLLEAHGVYAQYHTLVPGIMNRDKTAPCPMEQAVADITGIEEGVGRIQQRLQELRAGNPAAPKV